MKRICSNKEKLSSRHEDLEHRFCSTGYKKEMVHSEIQKVHSMKRENLLKNVKNRITMIVLLWF